MHDVNLHDFSVEWQANSLTKTTAAYNDDSLVTSDIHTTNNTPHYFE